MPPAQRLFPLAWHLLMLLLLVNGASALNERVHFDRLSFTDGTSYRTDLCDIAQRVSNGTVKLNHALKGFDLSVAVVVDPLFFSLNTDGTIDDGTTLLNHLAYEPPSTHISFSSLGCTSCIVKSVRYRRSFVSSPLWKPEVHGPT